MLEEKERLFLNYWSVHREKERRPGYQLLTGLPIGLLFALPIIFLLFTGKYWYKRADMVANSKLSLGVLAIAIVLIALFISMLYKRHQWEMKEQQFMELKAKDKKNS